MIQIPGFVGSASRMFPPEINAMGSNFVFYVMVLTIGYSVFSNVQVILPRVMGLEAHFSSCMFSLA